MSQIESPAAHREARESLLALLQEHMAQLQKSQAVPAEPVGLSGKKFTEKCESVESGVDNQQSSSESDSIQPESGSVPVEPGSVQTESDSPITAKKFAMELEKLDADLRAVAMDLYQHLHHRTVFGKLTAVQRDAILELLKYHSGEDVAKILALPPPIGMNLQTSKAGINRFRDEYMRCAMRQSKLESHRDAEEQRAAAEESFHKANTSDESFRQITERQIRKRLFEAAHDPASDYHEIRWLLKSLQMLRKTEAPGSAGPPQPAVCEK